MRLPVVLIASALVGLAGAGCGAGGAGGGASAGTQPNVASADAQAGIGPVGSARVAPIRSLIFVHGRSPLSDGDADNPEDVDGNPDHDPKGDSDTDARTRASYRFPDADDTIAFDYGHGADAAQRASVTPVVERYLRAARAGQGGLACSLLLPSIARAVPATYGEGVGSRGRHRGETCATVIKALFKHYRQLLASARMVVAVRVQGSRAEAILGSFAARASNIFLDRQGRSWGVEQPLVTTLL
jgi:hypothetical protein